MCLCAFGESMRVNKEPQSIMWCYSRTGEHLKRFKFEELFSCEERCHVSKAHRETERKRSSSRTPPPSSTVTTPGFHCSYFGDSREAATVWKPIRGDKYLVFALDYFRLNPQTVWYLLFSDGWGIWDKAAMGQCDSFLRIKHKKKNTELFVLNVTRNVDWNKNSALLKQRQTSSVAAGLQRNPDAWF